MRARLGGRAHADDAAVVGATTDSCSASCSARAIDRVLTLPDDAAVITWSVIGGALVAFGAVALGIGVAGSSSPRPVTLRPDGFAVTF